MRSLPPHRAMWLPHSRLQLRCMAGWILLRRSPAERASSKLADRAPFSQSAAPTLVKRPAGKQAELF